LPDKISLLDEIANQPKKTMECALFSQSSIATEIAGFMDAIKHNGAKFHKTPFLGVEKFDQKAIPAPQNIADMLYPDFPG